MTLWPGIARGAEECGKSTVHPQRGGLSVLYPVWLFWHSSAEFSSVCHEHPTQSALGNRSRDSVECHSDVLGCTETKQ